MVTRDVWHIPDILSTSRVSKLRLKTGEMPRLQGNEREQFHYADQRALLCFSGTKQDKTSQLTEKNLCKGSFQVHFAGIILTKTQNSHSHKRPSGFCAKPIPQSKTFDGHHGFVCRSCRRASLLAIIAIFEFFSTN